MSRRHGRTGTRAPFARKAAMVALAALAAWGTSLAGRGAQASVVEDFESGNLSAWNPCGAWAIVSPGHNSSRAVMTTGTPCCGAVADRALTHLTFNQSFGRYSFDVMLPAGGSIQDGGLAIQLQGGDFIQCQLGPVGGDNAADLVRRVVSGTSTSVACTPLHLTAGTWHRVDLERYSNGVIRVYTDGALKMEGYEPSLTGGGMLALVAHGTSVQYDNIAFDPSLPTAPQIPQAGQCPSLGLSQGCPLGATAGPACSDGVDNDGDGCADYPADLGCTSSQDQSEAGLGCAGPPPPQCQVSTDSLRFGNLALGQSAYKWFTITNAGGSTLSGSVSVTSEDFSILGDPAYSLGPGQSKFFQVQFSPQKARHVTRSIGTGALCQAVTATGTGVDFVLPGFSPFSLLVATTLLAGLGITGLRRRRRADS